MNQLAMFELEEEVPPPPPPKRLDLIDSFVLDILRGVSLSPKGVLRIEHELDRPTYEAVDEVLVRLRGKYSTAKKGHVFPFDEVTTQALLEAVLESGVMPPKNPLALYASPPSVVNNLLGRVEEGEIKRILEPSAGYGAIADALREKYPDAQLDLVELDPLNVDLLKKKGYNPWQGDFLDWRTGGYDLIVMNPPFSVKGDADAYQTHIRHAFSLLAKEGQLVAVAPTGFTFREDGLEFHNWVNRYGYVEKLPPKSFESSGVIIDTYAIWMREQNIAWRNEERQGFRNYDTWELDLYMDNCATFNDFACREAKRCELDLTGLPKNLAVWRSHYLRVIKERIREGDSFQIDKIDFDELIRSEVEAHQE